MQTTRSSLRNVYLNHLGFAMMSAPLVVRHTGVTRCGPCSSEQVGAYVLFRLGAYYEIACVSADACGVIVEDECTTTRLALQHRAKQKAPATTNGDRGLEPEEGKHWLSSEGLA